MRVAPQSAPATEHEGANPVKPRLPLGAGPRHIRAMSHRLIAHAIVSDDDCIADSEGRFPEALRNDADWRQFQAALDRAPLTLIGRASHEAAPNVKRRRRLILSHRVRGLAEDGEGCWFNPADVPLAAALDRLLPDGGEVAVPGGQAVFDLVGPAGFAEFHLARAHGVRLPGGRGLFAACEAGTPAGDMLSGGGLVPGPSEMIDPAARVSLTIWRRP